MEIKDRLQKETGKFACSSTEVQKLFKHIFFLVVPFFPHFWRIFYKSTEQYSQRPDLHLFLSFPYNKGLRDDHTSKHHVYHQHNIKESLVLEK